MRKGEEAREETFFFSVRLQPFALGKIAELNMRRREEKSFFLKPVFLFGDTGIE